jgi:hypothetical protein
MSEEKQEYINPTRSKSAPFVKSSRIMDGLILMRFVPL